MEFEGLYKNKDKTGTFFWNSKYTSKQDFGTRKVYCVSNVTFDAESKYAIKIFSITHSFYAMAFLIIDFSEFLVFSSVIFFIHEQKF